MMDDVGQTPEFYGLYSSPLPWFNVVLIQVPLVSSHSAPQIQLEGTVQIITFHNPDNGFCVLRITTDASDTLHTVVGQSLYVAVGEHITCDGIWIEDSQYGRQFKASTIRLTPPQTLVGIEKYLGSGLIHGIGPHFAKTLVKHFKEKVFDVIEHEPERLLTLPGIGRQRQEQLLKAWSEQSVVRHIMVFLQSFGLGTSRATRIYKTYGDQAIEVIKHNPYCLCVDIHGVGFRTADTIALKLGVAEDANIRIHAALRHVLQERANLGHCAANLETLSQAMQRLIGVNAAQTTQALRDMVQSGQMLTDVFDDDTWYFLEKYRLAEIQITGHFERILGIAPHWSQHANDAAVTMVQDHLAMTLSPSQQQAFLTAIRHKCTIITGGPGVGKTTLVKSIIHWLNHLGMNLALTAPTGRAAKRLEASTGRPAKTIHRLLEFDPAQFGFKRNHANPIDADIVVIDEASMIDVVLMSQLMDAVDDATGVIVVGDVDQLPSVGPGSVLADLIDAGTLPTVKLTEIFRQAEDSTIIINAHRINQGLSPLPTDQKTLQDFYFIHLEDQQAMTEKIMTMVQQRIPQRFHLDPIQDIQILTPMHKGTLGTQQLNLTLQQTLNPNHANGIRQFGQVFALGDKVIQHHNNYDKAVFNGDIGTISHIDREGAALQVAFEGRMVQYDFQELDELSLAYATTIHKSQGSEFPAVIVPLVMQHFMLLERNLLYTAVTRAKKLVVLIGENKALHTAIKVMRARHRDTFLKHRMMTICTTDCNP